MTDTMNFELAMWGDGTINLSYEDSLHGHDLVICLGDDNVARLGGYDDDDYETWTQIDLVAYLRELVEKGGGNE